MKKIISLAVVLAMVLSVVPFAYADGTEEPATTVVEPVRAMYFNSADELRATDHTTGNDNLLIATNGGDGWASATSFTDIDGTVTNQASLNGTGFSTPRNAVIAFELPDIDYDKLISATLSITVKNVKQVTGGERLGIYGNSLMEPWTVDASGKAALGAGSDSGLASLEMLGFTTPIATGNQTAESPSGETITMSTLKLVQYLKELKAAGYTEVTFRIANNLGGIRIYDINHAQKPTLTLETGDAVDVTIRTVLSDGTPVEDITVTAVAGSEFTYASSESVLNIGDAYYIFNEEESSLTITPTIGGENIITLAYDKFEGTGLTGSVVSEEGATCWFADPRSLTVKNEELGIDKTYVGYIDVHGSVKAFQYDNNTGAYDEVLIRSNFQPDDHNNPTFLELPDGRIMIFYSRHTDEPCFYYRVSKEPYDITTLGEEKYLATTNNTTYPNPFILSADPDHIYLCWRGVNWHPTIGRITIPDENGDVTMDLEKQIVQSTGARPYAKYTSNGVDEIWVTYTTGHPDNEWPNWLYFNKIEIPTLDITDVNGNVVGNVNDGPLSVNKTDASQSYIVDSPSSSRDWVWEVVNDNGTPVIAMVDIDNGKTNHNYYSAAYIDGSWRKTFLAYAGGKFHSSNTEYCYSGGMTIDKDNPHVFYCSVPVEGVFGNVFEIVKYTLNEDYSEVISTEYITENSRENNVRPYIANGSEEGDLRLTWMNGYYQFWMVRIGYPDGYPTRMMTNTELAEPELVNTLGEADETIYAIDGNTETVSVPASDSFTISMELLQSDLSVGGTLLSSGNLEIALEKQTVDPTHDYAAVAPKLTVGDVTAKSDNLFSNSDWFATGTTGTNSDKGVNSMGWINYTITYDADTQRLVTYVNGLVDANLQNVDVALGETAEIGGIEGLITNVRTADVALSQAEVRAAAEEFDSSSIDPLEGVSLGNTENITSDLLLPAATYDGQAIEWSSSDEAVITNTGAVTRDSEAHEVILTATQGENTKDFTITVAPKEDVNENLLFKYDFSETYTDENQVMRVRDVSGNGLDAEVRGTAAVFDGDKLDLTANTADGWDTNGYLNVPYDFLDGLRSYTVIQKVQSGNSVHPRLYDFGTGNQNSMFTRVDAFTAGIKYNSGTTLMVGGGTTGGSLSSAEEQWVVTVYNAATGLTSLYIDGELIASDATVTYEPYQISGGTDRNYIGRTQWWDYGTYGPDNQDFNGTIDDFMFFNAALTEEEIAQVTSGTSEPEEPEFSFSFDGTTAAAENAEGDYVIAVAQYDGDGSLLEVLSAENASVTVEQNAEAATAKAFIWDGLDSMSPLAAAIEVTYGEN